jgi:hypothetical protein
LVQATAAMSMSTNRTPGRVHGESPNPTGLGGEPIDSSSSRRKAQASSLGYLVVASSPVTVFSRCIDRCV